MKWKNNFVKGTHWMSKSLIDYVVNRNECNKKWKNYRHIMDRQGYFTNYYNYWLTERQGDRVRGGGRQRVRGITRNRKRNRKRWRKTKRERDSDWDRDSERKSQKGMTRENYLPIPNWLLTLSSILLMTVPSSSKKRQGLKTSTSTPNTSGSYRRA